MTAHALLETARDALFLRHLPADKLPLAYLAIALLALASSRVCQAASARMSRRRLLTASLLCGSLVTALFWGAVSPAARWALGALYVWTGVLATALVLQLWLLLADVVHARDARRVFAVVGAGALAGAVVGSLAAALLLHWSNDDRSLVLAAATMLAFTAGLPWAFPAPAPQAHAPPLPPAQRDHPPLAALVAVALLGAMLVTGGDYVFKVAVASAAARHGWRLGPLFARFYALVNAVSLLVQVLLVPRLLRAGPRRALLVLPALALLGAAGFSLTSWLGPALLLKAADGTLRHSLHRTATELVYLPHSPSARERLQSLADTVGQRGGQAVASLLILGLGTWSTPRVLPIALTLVAAAWLAVSARAIPR